MGVFSIILNLPVYSPATGSPASDYCSKHYQMEKDTLHTIIETGFASLGRRLDSIGQRVDTLAKRFDFMETKIDDLEKKNEIVSRELKEFRTFAEKRFDDLCIKITFLEQEVYKIGAVINYNEQYENMKRLD